MAAADSIASVGMILKLLRWPVKDEVQCDSG